MFDNLKQYLKDNVSPEMYEMFRDADEALKKNNDMDHDDVFDDILMQDGSVDTGETQREIFAAYDRILRRNLGDYSVTATEDATIAQMTTLLNGIGSIMTFDDADTLLQTSTLELNPQECLAELIALCAGENIEDMLTYIGTVSSALITRVRELATKEEQMLMTPEELAREKELAHSLKVFCNFIDNHNLRTNVLISNGVGVGFPFLVYANTIGRDFETMIPLRAAQEMIAMALISSDGYANPRSVIKPNIDKFIADVDLITKIDIMISDLLVRTNR